VQSRLEVVSVAHHLVAGTDRIGRQSQQH
jgi:hypothetical protein